MSASALSPAVIAATHDLELAARLVVEGLRAGGHRSPFHGYSAEFQQHRPYRIGDDLKYLDWKVLARTDRLYSRQFRETTSMSVMLVLDTSASMNFPEHMSKFVYARITAASLAYLISTQGDAVGLMTATGGRLTYLPARGGRLHLRATIAQIDRLNPGGLWQADAPISRAGELLKRRGVLIVISDFADDEERTMRALRQVARRGHDVSMIQINAAEELEFPYTGDVEFEDLETGERRMLHAEGAAASYRTAVREYVDQLARTARAAGIEYARMTTADPPDRALRRYLLQRAANHT